MNRKLNRKQVRAAESPHGLPNVFDALEPSIGLAFEPIETSLLPKRAVRNWELRNLEHEISADNLAWAWEALDLPPSDYAHLEPHLANDIMRLWPKFEPHEWNQMWNVIRAHRLEAMWVDIYEEFYIHQNWILEADAVSLGVFRNMHYESADGLKWGYLEFVRLGTRFGMRGIALDADGGGKVILAPPSKGTPTKRLSSLP